MPNGKSFGLCFILFVFCLTIKGTVLAEDCCDGKGTPTSAGNAGYSDDWKCKCAGVIPVITIVSSSETIVKGSSITLWINSSGLNCHKYTWSTTSKGYTLSKTKTLSDQEAVTLSCTTGTCGTNYAVYVTITAIGPCGVTDDIVIRNTAGHWNAGTGICLAGSACGSRTTTVENIVGSKKYELVYCGGEADPRPKTSCDVLVRWPCNAYLISLYGFTGGPLTGWTRTDINDCDSYQYQASTYWYRTYVARQYDWVCP